MVILSTTIGIFSNEWFLYNSLTFFLIVFLFYFLKRCSSDFIESFNKKLAFLFIVEFIFFNVYQLIDGTWSLTESLPFHLCSLMWFNSIYLLIYRKQWSFELMLFIGMPAAFHSLLTPQLNHGNNSFYIFDFFFSHGWLFAISFYCIYILNMRPRILSWWYSFLKLQDIIILVFIVNFFVNIISFGYLIPPLGIEETSNYMYLLSPPIADNPFVLGPWPNYLLGLLFATFLHSIIIYLPFYYFKKIKK